MKQITDLENSLRVGDIVFTRIGTPPFTQIADATGTTVTPESLYTCRSLRIVFDGTVALNRRGPP